METTRLAVGQAGARSGRTRRYTTRRGRAEWVRKFEESGKSAAEFCRELGLANSTFALWRRQERKRNGTEALSFSEVPQHLVETVLRGNAPAVMPAGAVVIHLHRGQRMEVAAGTEVNWVAQLVGALGEVC